MPDTNDKDIDALLDLLAAQSHIRFHSALTALVAERNALKQRVAELTGDLNVLVADRSVSMERLAAAKNRIAELEAQPLGYGSLLDREEAVLERLAKEGGGE